MTQLVRRAGCVVVAHMSPCDLSSRIASINGQCHASHPAGILARQKDARSRQVLRLAEPVSESMLAYQHLHVLRIGKRLLRHARSSIARTYAIHMYPVRAARQRGGACQADDSMFRRGVGGSAWIRHQA